MRGTLAAHDIVKTYGAGVVVDGVSFTVGSGDRVGVVGANGIGKSTLLRILAGIEPADSGSVRRTPPELAVAYVPQEPDALPGETIRTYVARRTGVADAEAALVTAADCLANDASAAAAYDAALWAFVAVGGGDLEARAARTAAELGLRADLGRSLAGLSGGEEARVRLAATLLVRADVLLLDEPTNDLDFDGLDRLEAFVGGFDGGVVCVSHDRAFLQRTVDRVLELEAETRRPRLYAGGWTEYERLRAVGHERHEAAFRGYEKERERFATLLAERRGDARAGGRQANRRATHALSTKVRAAEKRLERLDEVEKPWRPWELRLDLGVPERKGDVVAELSGAVADRGAFRLGPIDLVLGWGERVAVLGPNGAGKSTLLGALLGAVPLAPGQRRIGPGIRVGELDQRRELFAGHEPLAASFVRASGLGAEEARTLLGRFGIRGSDVGRPADSLSPGERTRAVLALLAARGVNVLVLDEPTNHLDLEAIEELERALAVFAGTVVLVTHDRRLFDAFAPTRRIELHGGRITIDA